MIFDALLLIVVGLCSCAKAGKFCSIVGSLSVVLSAAVHLVDG